MEATEMTDSSTVDPVLRCDSCQKLVRVDSLHRLGCCDGCGNKRVRALLVFSEEEKDQIEAWGYRDFLKAFEEVVEDE